MSRVYPIRRVRGGSCTETARLARAAAGSPVGTMDEPDDATVIQQSIEDPDRFHVIFDRHAREIYRYLARRLEPSVAEDLVGETFLAAFRRRERYVAERADARPWLYGIATKLVHKHWREEARTYRKLRRAEPHASEAGHADAVASAVTAQSARAQLSSALARLRKPDRDVLLLAAWEELSYEEIATALEIPIGTVRSWLNRCPPEGARGAGRDEPRADCRGDGSRVGLLRAKATPASAGHTIPDVKADPGSPRSTAKWQDQRLSSEDSKLHDRWNYGDVDLQRPNFAYLQSLPHDPKALAVKVRETCAEDGCNLGGFNVVTHAFQAAVVPPDVRSGLLKAAKRIDDVRLIEDVRLAATGERGVAVAYTAGVGQEAAGRRFEMVFDPKTYEILSRKSARRVRFPLTPRACHPTTSGPTTGGQPVDDGPPADEHNDTKVNAGDRTAVQAENAKRTAKPRPVERGRSSREPCFAPPRSSTRGSWRRSAGSLDVSVASFPPRSTVVGWRPAHPERAWARPLYGAL